MFFFRFPLTLESGTQCKVIGGFGKTICARLDQKLAEHRSRTERIDENLRFPVSPVLEPSNQNLPVSNERSPTCVTSKVLTLDLDPPYNKCEESKFTNSPIRSPPRSCVFDLSPKIDIKTQEEKDAVLQAKYAFMNAAKGGILSRHV